MAARVFDGSTNRLDWQNVANLAGAAWTFSCWVKFDAFSLGRIFAISNDPSSPTGNALIIYHTSASDGPGDNYAIRVAKYASTIMYSTTAVNAVTLTGTWYHILVTCDGSLTAANTKIYVNGATSTGNVMTNGTGTPTPAIGVWSLGGQAFDNNRNLDGMIADPGVWNRVLTAGEIAGLVNRCSPLLPRFAAGRIWAPPLSGMSYEADPVSGFVASHAGTTVDAGPWLIRPGRSKAYWSSAASSYDFTENMIMTDLRQSTATSVMIGPFRNTSGVPVTDLTIAYTDVLLFKNGNASYAAKEDINDPAHSSNGDYICALGSDDTDTLGQLMLLVYKAGAAPVKMGFNVVRQEVYDAKYDTGNLPADVLAISGGDTGSADALKDFADAGYDPVAHKIEETKVLTGHTAQTGDVFGALPSNFADLAIAETTGLVTAGNMVAAPDNAGITTILNAVLLLMGAGFTTESLVEIKAAVDAAKASADDATSAAEDAYVTAGLAQIAATAAARPGDSMIASNMIVQPVLGADDKVILSSDAHPGAVVPTVTTLTNAPTGMATQAKLVEVDAEVEAAAAEVTSILNSAGAGGASKPFVVNDSLGAPIPGATVRLYDQVGRTSYTYWGVTNLAGRITFSLPAGTYYPSVIVYATQTDYNAFTVT